MTQKKLSNWLPSSWIFIFCFFFFTNPAYGQPHSIAREWNELLLSSIRNDFARPTIHARNLFHVSIAMYDSWALFDPIASTYLIGKEKKDFKSSFNFDDVEALRMHQDLEQTISYAVYRIIMHRYQDAPKFDQIQSDLSSFMTQKGYDLHHTEFDYTDGHPASLGNFIGLEIIKYGLGDGANEQNDYENTFYIPFNPPLNPNTNLFIDGINPDRWQPLFFSTFIDQAGNPLPEEVPEFLSPEWGAVEPFSLEEQDRITQVKDGQTYHIYLDPGTPPLLNSERPEEYQWGFSLVAKWAAHLDPNIPVTIDISPASIGNIGDLPEQFEDYQLFYKDDGGDGSQGHDLNPSTGQPYAPQWVSRGDYTRVLAEFWADGPDSETPPGHWFTILNYVMDQPEFERRYHGAGAVLSDLEYDVKAYFMLGGAMHDAAIAAWSVKGFYDYIRPISALRYMANQGQSSDENLPNYHPNGIPLQKDFIEIVEAGDPQFPNQEDLGKIKIKSWRGPDYIDDPATDYAGVGWILAENWWPYQRPSFVTPPFAGYVSGHSTYSRTAAEVLTYLTGDPFFPGGMGEFEAKQNEFLVFEEGPSTDIILQWATYRDASDQCSLSRIWGGIHPPCDDIPGRTMGIAVANKVVQNANEYFTGAQTSVLPEAVNNTLLYPNPIAAGDQLKIDIDGIFDDLFIMNALQQVVYSQKVEGFYMDILLPNLSPGVYFVVLQNDGHKLSKKLLIR